MGLGFAVRTPVGRATQTQAYDTTVPSRASASSRSPSNTSPGSDCPELACLVGQIDETVLADAARRAIRIGTGGDRVLIARGQINEETYVRALANSLGVGFEPFFQAPSLLYPPEDDRLIKCIAAGMLPMWVDDILALVVAPRNLAARRLTDLIGNRPELAEHLRFTTAAHLNRFAVRSAGLAIAMHASEQLRQTTPEMSASNARGFWCLAVPVVAALAGLAGPIFAPSIATGFLALLLSALFLASLGLRLGITVAAAPVSAPPPALTEDALPVYTIIAALYHEAASVDGLLAAIERLDYPVEKLDIILAVEADDRETRAAIEARKSRLPILVLPVPPQGPRTKPKALNFALPFARGTFVAIYDAEDDPEPQQLRRSLQAFARGGVALACVQAALCIDNTADGWLTRMCTAEYAGQFDLLLPGLAAMRLPMPLGGSSNHFRTDALRRAGGWDPYNVTEDADLGVRLARLGYRCGAIESTTYEEAPARLSGWLPQRTRWFKGWMQTWLTHARAPGRLLRDLGVPGFVAFHLMIGGSALAALVHPFFCAAILIACLAGVPPWSGDGLMIMILLYGPVAAAGYLLSGLFGWLGLARRGLSSTGWVLASIPIHWLLLSLAAWRALCQLFVAPYKWEKTEHGLARNSRRNPAAHAVRRARVEQQARNTSAAPRLLPAAAVSG